MKTLVLSLLFAALPAWGHFCEHLLEARGTADVAMEVETPAFVDTLEEMELPYQSIQLGHALGRELVRLGISLTDNRKLIAFLKQVLDDAFRQATLANGFDPDRKSVV